MTEHVRSHPWHFGFLTHPTEDFREIVSVPVVAIPIAADTDDDGVSDGEEVIYGTDPLNPASAPNVPVSAWLVALGLLAFGTVLGSRRLRRGS